MGNRSKTGRRTDENGKSRKIDKSGGSGESVLELEQSIARMESRIQELDQQLEGLAEDSAALEQTWNERERLSAAYDELLAQWAEM